LRLFAADLVGVGLCEFVDRSIRQKLCSKNTKGEPFFHRAISVRTESPVIGKCCRVASFWLLLSLVPFLACNRQPEKKTEIIVAAASDLTPAFEELGRTFEQSHPHKVIFSFGSSGMLARQIENGAPMDLFAAANSQYIDDLERIGLIVPGTRALYARGRITIWTTKDSPLKIEKIEDLIQPEVKRIAIANPEHAPYGTIALEALQKAGLWDKIQPRIIYGENIRQTLQFAQTGNVDVALVALSLSLRTDGRWVLVPQELHRPLDQALGVIKGSRQEHAAREFAAFINSAQGREIMGKYGFTLPGD
jgi:molybdate transport system substrate-binding protein